ncbi:hypothetical protein GJ744_007818 [Endocarpon pusillum]|uniref:Uncharacterized protein n=1 Tax=Endocarpon pusillum TaxID=364733 RepID=A0A8H7ASZ5_9EURO|nr:hypothetical protein GJ744_007818 [Endocarpon pusillum]
MSTIRSVRLLRDRYATYRADKVQAVGAKTGELGFGQGQDLYHSIRPAGPGGRSYEISNVFLYLLSAQSNHRKQKTSRRQLGWLRRPFSWSIKNPSNNIRHRDYDNTVECT